MSTWFNLLSISGSLQRASHYQSDQLILRFKRTLSVLHFMYVGFPETLRGKLPMTCYSNPWGNQLQKHNLLFLASSPMPSTCTYFLISTRAHKLQSHNEGLISLPFTKIRSGTPALIRLFQGINLHLGIEAKTFGTFFFFNYHVLTAAILAFLLETLKDYTEALFFTLCHWEREAK